MFFGKDRVRLCFILLCLVAAFASAHNAYTGYSGAPGSSGTCSITCHGASGGTITATGFPTSYDPATPYTVTIGHNGGSAIINFNASCRVGTTSTNSGTIAAGTGTAVYNASGETNGAHFSTSFNNTSGTFTWTSPAKGTGSVKLYVAGIQGSGSSGATNALVLTATEAASTVISTVHGSQQTVYLQISGASPVNIALPAGMDPSRVESFTIFDLRGHVIPVKLSGNATSLEWAGLDNKGRSVPAGTYLYSVKQGSLRENGKFILNR